MGTRAAIAAISPGDLDIHGPPRTKSFPGGVTRSAGVGVRGANFRGRWRCAGTVPAPRLSRFAG